ncbi:protein ENHANCED DOWNY MILDEW 2-like isoform X1 [Senna tora]|uniref:Protein ENHANCED DOWNY MILDEW 2-like isoform X1 n=1 Tax=Senna tora TaxID=362788 RepID=A0A834TUK1_9FABA|nr:protein ENHANCED DOWNY MILDEW 2-like isoform X1 [Senna tora]
MKSKLEQIGKSCSFKNYDIFQAKNDFNFEKRDWMSVNVEELPDGSKLIIGLNPPFGVKGSLAYKFITKALTFKPKLLKGGYNLIWEDDEVLSGKQMEDWNQKTPPLYLWSRPDWTAQHIEIAQRQGHIKEQYAMHVKEYNVKNYLMEENHDCYQHYSGLHAPDDICTILEGIPEDNSDNVAEGGSSIPAMMETLFPHYGRAGEMQVDMDLSTP